MKNKHQVEVSIGEELYKEIKFMSKMTNRSIEHCASRIIDIAYHKMNSAIQKDKFQSVCEQLIKNHEQYLSIRRSRHQKRSQLLFKNNDKI